MAKTVQIPVETFYSLCRFFLLDETDEDEYQAVKSVLEGKLDAIVRHETYSAYKTAKSPQERKKARQKYLDMVSIKEGCRGEDKCE